MIGLNEYGTLKRLTLRHARDAFVNQDNVDQWWGPLNYHQKPDFQKAISEYECFTSFFSDRGVQIEFLPPGENLSMDAMYVRDASIVSEKGLILCNMGKKERTPEPAAANEAYTTLGLPVAGAIQGDGRLEGGDFLWLDEKTCVVGRGYRTNDGGIRQLKALLGPSVEVVVVPLPHYKGPSDVFHLMSIISPLDKDLMLVYSPLMVAPFREYLLERGCRLVEVPDEEFETMGCNVLALGPRTVLAVNGNPETRRRMEAAGCETLVYDGWEISRKGEGGPTCLTRPIDRES